jgi:hypothetical protein
MWKVLLLLIIPFKALAAPPQVPIIWGNNNNAIYLPTNRPGAGFACLTIDPMGVITPQACGGGGGSVNVVTIAGNFSANTQGQFILANCAVLCTVNLPNIALTDGFTVSMKNIGIAHAVFHNIVGQDIDGLNDWDLNPDKSHVTLISSGGKWYVY